LQLCEILPIAIASGQVYHSIITGRQPEAKGDMMMENIWRTNTMKLVATKDGENWDLYDNGECLVAIAKRNDCQDTYYSARDGKHILRLIRKGYFSPEALTEYGRQIVNV
jgi:hypothetical protein